MDFSRARRSDRLAFFQALSSTRIHSLDTRIRLNRYLLLAAIVTSPAVILRFDLGVCDRGMLRPESL